MNKKQIKHKLYRILFLVLLGCFVLGKVATITLFSFNISFFEISVALFVLYSFCVFPQYIHAVLKHPSMRAFFPLFVYMAISLLLVLLTQSQHVLGSSAYTFRFFIFVLLLPSFFVGIRAKAITKQQLLTSILLASFTISVLGILQYFFLPDTRFLFFLGWDDHYYRLISTLFDPPFIGAVAALGVLLVLGMKTKKHTLVLLTVFLLTVLLTYSRATYVALASSLVVLAIMKRSKLPIIILGVFLLCIPLLPRPASEGARLERTASIESREQDTTMSLRAFTTQTWIIGNGWYTTQAQRQPQPGISASHSSAPGNSYIHMLQSLGIVGFGICIYTVLCIVGLVKKNATALSSIIFLGVGSVFNNLLFYPWIMALLMGILVLAITEDT